MRTPAPFVALLDSDAHNDLAEIYDAVVDLVGAGRLELYTVPRIAEEVRKASNPDLDRLGGLVRLVDQVLVLDSEIGLDSDVLATEERAEIVSTVAGDREPRNYVNDASVIEAAGRIGATAITGDKTSKARGMAAGVPVIDRKDFAAWITAGMRGEPTEVRE